MISSISRCLTCSCCYPVTEAEEGLIHSEEQEDPPVDIMTSGSGRTSPLENFVGTPRSASGHFEDEEVPN